MTSFRIRWMLTAALVAGEGACELLAPVPAPRGMAGGSGGSATMVGAGGSGVDPSSGAGWANWPMPNPPTQTDLPRPRHYDLSDADVAVDLVTRLRWQRTFLPGVRSWNDALAACAFFGSGWRLPTRIEVVSLLGIFNDNLDPQAFPDAPWEPTWSSSTLASDGRVAFCVDLSNGRTTTQSKTEQLRTLCVNEGGVVVSTAAHYTTSPAVPDEVYDTKTTLTWQRAISSDLLTWGDAQVRCFARGAGWRLPSLTEAQTIVDETRSDPAIDDAAFPAAPAAVIWTASYEDDVPTQAYFLDLASGQTDWGSTFTPRAATCVR